MMRNHKEPNLEQLGGRLRAARRAKGLSQRELSQRSGFTQAHISRIESGLVDLQASSLLELARSLDLELTLTPRQAKPAIEAIVRSAEAAAVSPKVRINLDRLNEVARALSHAAASPALSEILRQNLQTTNEGLQAVLKKYPPIANALRDPNAIRELDRLTDRLSAARRAIESIDLGDRNELLRQHKKIETLLGGVSTAAGELSELRNRVTHHERDTLKPAYALDDSDED